MKKMKLMLVFIIAIVMLLSINSFAAVSCSSLENTSSDFLKAGENAVNDRGVETSAITNEVLPIVQILLVIGILIVGCCMVILGIQWVMSKASPEAQGKLKEKFISLVVAAGVIFGSYTIWSIILNIMTSIDG